MCSGWVGKGRFFYYYIYISSFKLLLEVRLDLPKQVCSVWPQRVPCVSPWDGGQGSRSGSSEERGFPALGDRSRSVCRCCCGASDLHEPAGAPGASPTPPLPRSIALLVLLLPSPQRLRLPQGLALPLSTSPFCHGQFGSQPKDLCRG